MIDCVLALLLIASAAAFLLVVIVGVVRLTWEIVRSWREARRREDEE